MGRGSHRPARWAGFIVLVLAVVAGVLVQGVRPERASAVWGAWIATEQASLRTAPGTWAEVAGQAWQGEWVEVQAGPQEGDWYEVAASAGAGWVEGSHLAFDQWVESDGQAWGGEEWAPAERWIAVDRGDGTVTLYEGDAPVRTWWAVMSADSSDDGFYATAIGTYHIYAMNESLAWSDWAQAFIANWVGFDPDRLNGFHSFSLDENGLPIAGADAATAGCVALPPDAASELFWSVYPGMRVEVHW
jgi:hypothetical protein